MTYLRLLERRRINDRNRQSLFNCLNKINILKLSNVLTFSKVNSLKLALLIFDVDVLELKVRTMNKISSGFGQLIAVPVQVFVFASVTFVCHVPRT